MQVPTDSLATCQAVAAELCGTYRVCVSGSSSYTVGDSDIACYWRLSAQVSCLVS